MTDGRDRRETERERDETRKQDVIRWEELSDTELTSEAVA